jgi:phosphatidylglycerol---prolipoprotein diacylglyceryl transferase
MRSELLRIPMTWGGVPIFGFGVLLVVWLCLGAWALASTAKQAGWPASLKAHLPTILIVAALIAFGIPKFFPDGAPLRSYGLLVLAGSVAGIAMTIYRARQAGLEADEILGLAVLVFIGGGIGARLFYVVEYWDGRIRTETWAGTIKNILAFTEGGLVVYGAFIGAMLGFAIGVTRRKLPALAMADLVAPGMMVGLCLGRIGCLLNGCCYGGESTAPWAVTFPRENAPRSMSPPYAEQAGMGRFYGLRLATAPGKGGKAQLVVDRIDADSPAERAGVEVGDVVSKINGKSMADPAAAPAALLDALSGGTSLVLSTTGGEKTIPGIPAPPRCLPVHPAQIYSSIDAGLLAWVLWSYYAFRRRDGEVMALMITIHPISRFLLEIVRVDESPVWNTGLSISQNLSIALLLVGAGLWLYLRRTPRGRLAFPLAAPLAT